MVTKRKKTPKKINKGGRPTDYDPTYCQKIIDFFESNENATLVKFAKSENLYTSTMDLWAKKHPEFMESKKKAFEAKKNHVLNMIEGLVVTSNNIKVNSVPLILIARAYGIKTSDANKSDDDDNDNQDFSDAISD